MRGDDASRPASQAARSIGAVTLARRSGCARIPGLELRQAEAFTIRSAGRTRYRLTPTACRCLLGVALGKCVSFNAAAGLMAPVAARAAECSSRILPALISAWLPLSRASRLVVGAEPMSLECRERVAQRLGLNVDHQPPRIKQRSCQGNCVSTISTSDGFAAELNRSGAGGHGGALVSSAAGRKQHRRVRPHDNPWCPYSPGCHAVLVASGSRRSHAAITAIHFPPAYSCRG